MTDLNLKPGDRVRVAIEGEIDKDGDLVLTPHDDYDYCLDRDTLSIIAAAANGSVEKVDSPVVIFKPGDRLRRRTDDGWPTAYEVTLADEGYLKHFNFPHSSGGRVRWYPYAPGDKFTSELFDKIELPA